MTEHEKLKEICDKIDLKTIIIFDGETLEHGKTYYKDGFFSFSDDCGMRFLDVREIIFTQEFMDKFDNYCDENGIEIKGNILLELDNPTKYLYNLLK